MLVIRNSECKGKEKALEKIRISECKEREDALEKARRREYSGG